MAKDIEAAPPGGEYGAKDYSDPPPAPLFDAEELTKWSLYRAVIAEFVATLLFLYITVATVIGYKHQADPAGPNAADAACSGVGILGIAWAFGGMIFVLVYCTAGVSGGHINPAVTFGLFLARKVSLVRALLYIIAQPGRHLRRGARQGVPERLLRALRRRRQRAQLRLLQGHRPRRGDHRHLRARLHRLLRHRPQAQRP